ncbi:MAG: acyl-CoA synthetase, partial [Acidimicrobiales bacterium]
VLASVYAVPDAVVGDQVMATLLLRPNSSFDPEGFAAFLAGEADLGTKWSPRYLRIAAELPVTATTKVVKRVLRAEAWHADDPVWWRPEPAAAFRRMLPADAEALDRVVAERNTGPT